MSRRKPTPTPTPEVLDMNASKWRFITDYGSNVGMPANPTQVAPDAFAFTFARYEDNPLNKVGYLLRAQAWRVFGGRLLHGGI